MPGTGARQYWVDNLRLLMIVLVVNMHACVAYSHVGSWYYMVDPEPPMMVKLLFAVWQGHLQAFFMGLLFFLAGYFADRSLTRRGAKSFLAERWQRLGIPTLLYMLLIHPFILLGLNPWHDKFPPASAWYRHYLLSGRFVGSSGPMWFAFALLIFSGILVAARSVRPVATQKMADIETVSSPVPGLLGVLLLGVFLGVTSFLVRTVQPIGSDILNFQLCFFPQYVVAFIAGVVVSRNDALRSIARSSLAWNVGRAALVCGPLALIALTVVGGQMPEHSTNPYFGGWHWQALGLALWEQVTGVCLGLGAMAWCVRYVDTDNRTLKWLSDRSFGVYLLHPPVLIGLTMVIGGVHGNRFLMAGVLTLLSLAGSFAAADIARRIPGMKQVV
jgi:peptidoglycan/LPS O-acetylase OafA/YrhL